MGRRNKKLARIQQSEQARVFLKHKEKAVSLRNLPKDEKRIEIAHTCTMILSNPELQYSKIESVLELCNDPDPYIQSLAISSICMVFIDVLPGYKIQEHEEEKITLSKEVKALRIYESSLLKFYESFIGVLKGKKNVGSVKCVCKLLQGLSHFNYREKLLEMALAAVCEVSDSVIPAIQHVLLGNDLEFRYFIVKSIEKYVKTNSYKSIPCSIIEILSQINFSMLQQEELPQKRGRDEEDKSKSLEVTMNQKTLREILSIYFIILKRNYNSSLLVPTLKGLSKYSGMLNIEIVLDLVKNLISLLKEHKVKGDNKFHCISACIKIISATQHALHYEDKDLTQILYAAVLSPPLDLESQKMFLESLMWLLVQQKQYSYELIAAFLKRILMVAFHCDLKLMKALLCLGKIILVKFPKAYLMMEQDDGADSYLSQYTDPYLAQAANSSILSQLESFKVLNDPQIAQLIKSYSVKNPFDKRPWDYLK